MIKLHRRTKPRIKVPKVMQSASTMKDFTSEESSLTETLIDGKGS